MKDNVDCTQYLTQTDCEPRLGKRLCSRGKGRCKWEETTSYGGVPYRSCTCALTAASPRSFDDYDDLFDDVNEDDLFDLASRPISPWPSLLRRAHQALQKALRALGPPLYARSFHNALNHAESLILQAAREIGRVMSGSRRSQVLNQLSNALIRIRAARAQARGGSLIPGARSLINPSISVRGAIAHVRQARQTVGLKLVRPRRKLS